MPAEDSSRDARAPQAPPARVWPAAALLVAAGIAAYHNSFSGPFVFDDPLAITENPTIRKLWPLTDVLLPPRGEGLSVEGRPVVNLTLAINHALGGTAVHGYHAVNLLIHLAATLTLFGFARRTLLLPRLRERFGSAALPLSALIALLWCVHPLQTESVTYVIQRAESLVALFYLLTLYCFVRAVGRVSDPPSDAPEGGSETRPSDGSESRPYRCSRMKVGTPLRGARPADLRRLPQVCSCSGRRESAGIGQTPEGGSETRPTLWFALSVVACLAGMATKEVMVSAPLLVLVFDRVFVSGSFRAAWRRRRAVHAALFATWIPLAALVIRTGTRGGTAGFGINVTPWDYALTQFEAVTHYVRLSFWPHPLIFDYGVAWVQGIGDVLTHAIVLLALIAGAIAAWWRAPAVAWLALLFFAVLSPTSSIVPGNRQTLAEHRMYLPLAPIVALVVCGGCVVARERNGRRVLFAGGLAIALAFTALTIRRNEDYRSEIALYRDTVAKRPQNGFARYNLGKVLAESGRHLDAVPEYEAALRRMGDVPGVHYNLANSLAELGRMSEARAHYEHALRTDPRYVNARFNLGNLLLRTGDKAAAAGQYRAILAVNAGHVEARANLAGVLLELGELADAREQFERVLREKPDSVEAHFGLGNVFLLQERWSEAARKFEVVSQLRPDLAIARERLELARSKAAK